MNKKLKIATIQSIKPLFNSLPILVGIVLLISLSQKVIPTSFYLRYFSYNKITDAFLGSSFGSIFAGNPITSYIMGSELLKQGVSLIAVTAFIVSWVTVGIVQLPAEAMLLGKKFALVRNATAYILSICVAIVSFLILSI